MNGVKRAVLLLAVLMAACGGTDEPAPPPASTPAATSTPAVDLTSLVVADDVLPGFKHGGLSTVQQDDVDEWAATNQEPDSAQLKELGFVAGARQDLVGPDGDYGLNIVERFETPEGAAQRASYTVRDLGNGKGQFEVDGIPGAVGFESGSGAKRGRSVVFSEDDTVFLLSHQVSKQGPSAKELEDAARKWYAAVSS